MPFPCHAVPLKVKNVSFPFDLHSAAVPDSQLSCHAMPMPCSDHAVLLKATAQHGRQETAVLCCDLEKKGIFGAWYGHDMASVNQTRPRCVNQMRKTHSKPLATRHGRGMAWARHGNGRLRVCVNRPLICKEFSLAKELLSRRWTKWVLHTLKCVLSELRIMVLPQPLSWICVCASVHKRHHYLVLILKV